MNFNSYYSRQMILPEIGPVGQRKLAQAKCLVVGAGGLGSPALLYLAAAGVGTLGICDGDLLEESNLHRQPIYRAQDLGEPKAKLAAERLQELNPFIQVDVHPFRLTEKNALSLFASYDCILDCTDNFRTKFLLSDAAYFSQKPLIRASIYQFEGQLQSYIPKRGDGCLRCLWEDVPQEGCVGTCQQVGVLGPVPGHFGLLQAMEAIKLFLGLPLLGANQILFVDLIHHLQQMVAFERRPSCPLCGSQPTIKNLSDKELWEIEKTELKGRDFILIDIREKEEVEAKSYQGLPVLYMPLSSFDAARLDASLPYAIFCHRGARSANLVRRLRHEGRSNVYSVIGGITALEYNG